MKPKGLAKTLLGTSALTAAIVVSFVATPAQAGTDWVGDTSTDWNDGLNWSGDTLYAAGDAITVNTSTGNIATITANPTNKPADVSVGNAAALTGRLDIRAGLLEQNVIGASGNWFFIGTGTGTGTVNIADTAVTGQSNLTTFGQGSGSTTVGKFWIGGTNTTSGTGTLNINTTGTVAAQSTQQSGTTAQDNSTQGSIILGSGAGSTGTVNLDSGTVNSTGMIWVGNRGGSGVWNQAGGTTTASALVIARRAGTGTVNVNGGTFTLTGDTANDINGGNVGIVVSRGANNVATQQGTLNIGGTGTVSSANDVLIGFAGGATSFGELNVNTGGTLNVGTGAEKWLIINRFDTVQGRLNVDGGTVNLQNNTDIRFSTGGGTGVSSVTVKNGGSIIGGTSSVVDLMNGNVAGNNTLNLDGGTLAISQIITNNNTGTAVVNLNGGTLRAAASTGAFIDLGGANQRVNVRNGGAIIDTNNFTVTIAEALNHSNIGGDSATDGGLTKNGLGTLTLTNAANTYTGNTLVNQGTLATGATGNLGLGNVTVANSLAAVLDLGNSNSIADTATLFFGSDSFIILSNGINETVFAATETDSSLSIGPGTYTAAQLNSFFGGDGIETGFSEDFSGTLTVVPEPSAALLGGLGVLGLLRRRRKA
jgi:autotransporter-associated beta strand protein